MEATIDAIRAALAADAPPEARAAGIEACRAVLGALQAKPGEPLGAPRPVDTGSTAHAIAAAIRSTPPDQLLDMLITKLRSAVPDAGKLPASQKLNIPLVRIPTP